MVTRGRVENGVVVLESGVSLPEGIEVTVIVEPASVEKPAEEPVKRHSVLGIPT